MFEMTFFSLHALPLTLSSYQDKFSMTEPPTPNRLRFIPFRKRDLVEMCLQDGHLAGQEAAFRQLYDMLVSIFHFEFHQITEMLKDQYAYIDPDSDTQRIDLAAQPASPLTFSELLAGLLDKANYEALSQADLEQALTEASLFPIRLQVDFDEFSEVLLFCRGESIRAESLSSWFGLRRKTIRFTNFDRVVVYLRFRDDLHQDDTPMPLCKPGATMLKLFQNVPKADLEMLFPNTRVRMRTIDKLLIGVPAVVSGGIVLTTKVGATLVLLGSLFGFWLGLSSQPVELNRATALAVLAGLGTLGAYLWRQFHNFKTRKLRFMQTLTQNLYFKNLDNNAGVIHRLADDAEEEECKEALLAYYFLWLSDEPLSAVELDRRIEQWLETRWRCTIDFEISDALNKLMALELVETCADQWTAVPLQEGVRRLDRRWDDYFVAARPA